MHCNYQHWIYHKSFFLDQHHSHHILYSIRPTLTCQWKRILVDSFGRQLQMTTVANGKYHWLVGTCHSYSHYMLYIFFQNLNDKLLNSHHYQNYLKRSHPDFCRNLVQLAQAPCAVVHPVGLKEPGVQPWHCVQTPALLYSQASHEEQPLAAGLAISGDVQVLQFSCLVWLLYLSVPSAVHFLHERAS